MILSPSPAPDDLAVAVEHRDVEGARRGHLSTGGDQELLELICEARRGGDKVPATGRYQAASVQR